MTGWCKIGCVIGALALTTQTVTAEPIVEYRVEWLTSAQRAKLDKQVENYALAEAFLSACGPPSRFEARVRSAAEGCIARESLEAISKQFRRLVSESLTRSKVRCGDTDVVQFARRMRQALDLTVGDIVSACRQNGTFPERLGK